MPFLPDRTDTHGELARTVLAVLLILVLISGSFYVLRPFLLPMMWALTIVVATWPLMLSLQARVKRRGVAVAIMSGAIVLVFVVPLVLMIETLLKHTDTITGWIQSLSTAALPPPPAWIVELPLVGAKVGHAWMDLAAAGKEELAVRVAPYAAVALQWLAGAAGSAGALGVQFLLTIVIVVILYIRGEAAREWLIRIGRRLAGERGEAIVLLAGQAIRAVALGVVVTAVVQTALAALGLFVAGIPFAGLLTALVLLLCIAQIGPIVVLVPAVIWLYWSGHPGSGTMLLVWSLPVLMLDNVLRPILIRRGADLPLLLIFAGVIGGLIAFGIIGLFVGPVVLAVAYTLLNEWIEQHPAGT
jgi:predicted PurR-regulated permease PerM